MSKFCVTKVVATDGIANFVVALNRQTHDGYIVFQTRISPKLWLLRIACSWRDDAALVRRL